MDIVKILQANYLGTQWSLTGTSYSGLVWLDESPKPTEQELLSQWPDVEYKLAYEKVAKDRQLGYQQTSDGIYFQWQRGLKTQQEWLDAVAAVDEANPYPEGVK